MTDSTFRATVGSVRLEMFIPFPDWLRAKLDAAMAETLAIFNAIPDYARPVPFVRLDDHPAVAAFCDALPWPEVRSEFSRKAKKLGAHTSGELFGVSFQCNGTHGLKLWCDAKGGSEQ